jgi:malate dehydrogenase (oxaloacetate-decarboxylating)
MAAINVTGVPLKDQTIALLGAGSAGCGIAALLRQAMIEDGLSPEEASRRFFAVDRGGLLMEGMNSLTPAQVTFAQARDAVASWKLETPGQIGLLDVAVNGRPTVLIGVSGQAGVFTEPIVKAMAAGVDRPVIFPLSNPTSRCEATPQQLLDWTDGRALIGVGSPFPCPQWDGGEVAICQTNNSYIFPGVGLGLIASGARRVTEAMFMAAARALAELSPTRTDKTAPLLPPVDQLREVARAVAFAVARQALADAVAHPCDEAALAARIEAHVWEPKYRPYAKVS